MKQFAFTAFLIFGQTWAVSLSPSPSTLLSLPQSAPSSNLSGPFSQPQESPAIFSHGPGRSLMVGTSMAGQLHNSDELRPQSPSESLDVIACKRILEAVESASPEWKGLYDCSNSKLLGNGNYATVFQVQGIPQKFEGGSSKDKDPQVPRLYALRASKITKANTEESLQAEFELLGKIDSPHVIKVYHRAVIPGETPDSKVFVSTLELANQGEFHDISFTKLIDDPKEEETDDQTLVGSTEIDYFYQGEPNPVLFYFKQMILAQVALDRAGYVGRDIKGQNMVLHDGILKYIDLVSAIEKGKKSQSPAGTPFFTDPDLFDRDKIEPLKKLCKDGTSKNHVALMDLMDPDKYEYGTYTDVYSLGMTLAFLLRGSNVYNKKNQKSDAPSCQIIRAIQRTGLEIPSGFSIIFAYILSLMLRTDKNQRASLEKILYVIHLLGNEKWVVAENQVIILLDNQIKLAEIIPGSSEEEDPQIVGEPVDIPNFFKDEALANQQIEEIYFKDLPNGHLDLDRSVYGDLVGGDKYQKIKTKIISSDGKKILRYVYLVDPSVVDYRKVKAEVNSQVVFDLPAFKEFFKIKEGPTEDRKRRLLGEEGLPRVAASPSLAEWTTGTSRWVLGICLLIVVATIIWVRSKSRRNPKLEAQISWTDSPKISLEG